ncbi:MAG: hypothetical protein MZV70_44575 [Desulfobacterales bacterium]|nr:hypothetical protein [Desulfobacterales bacterium]
MSMAIGASAGGVRIFTATVLARAGADARDAVRRAADPPAHRHGQREPFSLGAGSGIWVEYNDSMAERDSGWLQVLRRG